MSETTQTPPADGEFENLLAYIHERRNFDFRGYKRGSLTRRIYKRMQSVGVDDYQRYMDVLEANPGEFTELFNTILINVTSFLRDREAWDILAESVIPSITEATSPGESIRVWSAGCASGEEAYSLAVLFAEAVGEEVFRRQVKIYATDADTEALMQARQGRYPAKDLEAAFGEHRVARFFEMEDGHGVFRPDLRRCLIFGRHDLVQDPPISRIDLLACRNTLMYFSSDVQRGVLANFHFALNRGGYLFLGKSEALVYRLNLFEVVDQRRHIFRKDGKRAGEFLTRVPAQRRVASPERAVDEMSDALLENSPLPQLVLDWQGLVLRANAQARALFSIGSSQVGAQLSTRGFSIKSPEMLRLVEQVRREKRVFTVPDVSGVGQDGDAQAFDVIFAPAGDHVGVSVTLVDVSRYRVLGENLEQSQKELESAYEELQSAVEELETTNEELQSTNEELETTNEELHSANEELETMNEELQSTNEELETTNGELRLRSDQVIELNTFLESVLSSFRSAVVVVGPDMQVNAWNRQAEELWGLRSEEVHGQHLLNLDIGLPVDTAAPAVRDCLAGRSEGEQLTLQAVNRRGRGVEVVLRVSPLMTDGRVAGVILGMDATPSGDGTGDGTADAASPALGVSPKSAFDGE